MAIKIDSDGNQVLTYPEILGRFIKNRRLELNMSQEDLANKMGYTAENSRSTIGKIESGKQDLTITRLKTLSKALDVDIEILVTLDETPSVGEKAYNKIIKYSDTLDSNALKRLAAYLEVLSEKENL